MLINLVFVMVKPEAQAAFSEATLQNALASRKEPLVARFDFLEDRSNPCKFVLLEAFRSEEGPARHKETAHYKKWREAVEGLLAEPRKTIRLKNISPVDEEY